MSERWSLWARNVIDRYKSWSTESIKKDLQRTSNPFAVCMEHWQGDFNISTLMRNANAFNAREVFYFGKKRFDRRGTVGSHHYIHFTHLQRGISELLALKKDYTIIGIENNVPNTCKLNQFNWQSIEKPPLMLFGEEGVGLTKEALELTDYCIEIPQYGSVRSLNVGTSSGIIMYDYVRFLKNSKAVSESPIKKCGENGNVLSESFQLTLL
jgi:tRNA G18 (ribose-2'-O)-methylase SpoU